MKLLTEELLKEFGFIENPTKTMLQAKVMTKDDFDVVIKSDGIYYINLGLSYPLKDNTSLKKLYKELMRKELLAI